MDKEWTGLPRYSREYKKGVKSFLNFAYTKGRPQGREILCPCAKCRNDSWVRRKVVYNHLIANGFLEGYDVWVNHGEDIPSPMKNNIETNDREDSHDDIGGLLYDTFRNVAREEGAARVPMRMLENRAKQKFMHRVGPVNFARIRAKLLAKKEDGEEVSQAEMFIETRKSRKGKTVDEETQTAIDTLQESIENSSEDVEKTFQTFFGKEKPGRVRSYGRTMTPSLMKKNEEIASIKKQYSNKITALEKKMQTYDAILKCVLMQQRPDLSEEAVDNLMQRAFENDNSAAGAAPRWSTSTNAPVHEKVGNEDDLEEDDFEDFEE